MGTEGYAEKPTTDYESMLGPVFLDNVSRADLKTKDTFPFVVTENFDCYIGRSSHGMLAEKHGFNLDTTLTEGYVYTYPDHAPVFKFKADRYQPAPGFRGSTAELRQLQRAAEKKMSDVIQS